MDRVDVGRSRDALDRHLSVAPMWLPKGFNPTTAATIEHHDAGLFASLIMIVMRVALAAFRN